MEEKKDWIGAQMSIKGESVLEKKTGKAGSVEEFFSCVDEDAEFQIGSRTEDAKDEETGKEKDPAPNPWLDDLEFLSFRQSLPLQSDPVPPISIPAVSDSDKSPKAVITFEEVPPIFSSSHSSGSHPKAVQLTLPVTDKEQNDSFEIITYESPVQAEESKEQICIKVNPKAKIEVTEGIGELVTSASYRKMSPGKDLGSPDRLLETDSYPTGKEERDQESGGDTIWPELTIQLPKEIEKKTEFTEEKTSFQARTEVVLPNPPEIHHRNTSLPETKGNPAVLRFRNRLVKQGNKEPPKPRKLSNEFEEDAMGEAREWQAYSANPDLNDDLAEERGDEFSFNPKTEVALISGAEKEYSSQVFTHEPFTLHAFLDAQKPPETKKSKKIGLKTRKMIAEARLKDRKTEGDEEKTRFRSESQPPIPLHISPCKSEHIEPIKIVLEERKSSNLIRPPQSTFPKTEATLQDSDPEDDWNRATDLARVEQEAPKKPRDTTLVTYTEIWPQFEQMDLSDFIEKEPPFRPLKDSWFTRCFRFSPEEIEVGELKEKVRRVLSLIHVAYDDSPLHLQLLMSFWKLMTGTKVDCPRYGRHWDELGFQGNDPATDLRSMGVFGLLQLLYFSSSFNEEAKMVLSHSQSPGHSFPFSAVSLNITKIVVESLREQHLNPFINKWRNVFDSVQFFYVGTFLYWFQIYQKRQLTIAEVGELNEEVLTEAKQHPGKMFQILKQIYRQKGIAV